MVALHGLGDDASPLTTAVENALAPATTDITKSATDTAIAEVEAKLMPIVTGLLVLSGIVLGAVILRRSRKTAPAAAAPAIAGRRR
jgi:hypothetical protein